MLLRLVALALMVTTACSRTATPEVAHSDPSTQPLPQPPPSPPTSKPPAPPPKPPVKDAHQLCEPVVRCGFWSHCVWLERVDATRYRVIGGDAVKGEIFVRRHHCSPADAGPNQCAVYCAAPDAGPPCVDGLHPESEACTEAAPPRPHAKSCPMLAGVCGSLM